MNEARATAKAANEQASAVDVPVLEAATQPKLKPKLFDEKWEHLIELFSDDVLRSNLGVIEEKYTEVQTALKICRKRNLVEVKTEKQACELLRKCGMSLEFYQEGIVQFLVDKYHWPLDASQAQPLAVADQLAELSLDHEHTVVDVQERRKKLCSVLCDDNFRALDIVNLRNGHNLCLIRDRPEFGYLLEQTERIRREFDEKRKQLRELYLSDTTGKSLKVNTFGDLERILQHLIARNTDSSCNADDIVYLMNFTSQFFKTKPRLHNAQTERLLDSLVCSALVDNVFSFPTNEDGYVFDVGRERCFEPTRTKITEQKQSSEPTSAAKKCDFDAQLRKFFVVQYEAKVGAEGGDSIKLAKMAADAIHNAKSPKLMPVSVQVSDRTVTIARTFFDTKTNLYVHFPLLACSLLLDDAATILPFAMMAVRDLVQRNVFDDVMKSPQIPVPPVGTTPGPKRAGKNESGKPSPDSSQKSGDPPAPAGSHVAFSSTTRLSEYSAPLRRLASDHNGSIVTVHERLADKMPVVLKQVPELTAATQQELACYVRTAHCASVVHLLDTFVYRTETELYRVFVLPYVGKQWVPQNAEDIERATQWLHTTVEQLHKVGVSHRDIRDRHVLVDSSRQKHLIDFSCGFIRNPDDEDEWQEYVARDWKFVAQVGKDWRKSCGVRPIPQAYDSTLPAWPTAAKARNGTRTPLSNITNVR